MTAAVVVTALTGTAVLLRTAIGDVPVTWQGVPPAAGVVVDVELDVVGTYHYDDLVVSQTAPWGFVVHDDGRTGLTGRVLDVDHLDTVTLDAGGAVLLIEMEGEAPLGLTSSVVTLWVGKVDAHPSGT